jgi:hypothetical protein
MPGTTTGFTVSSLKNNLTHDSCVKTWLWNEAGKINNAAAQYGKNNEPRLPNTDKHSVQQEHGKHKSYGKRDILKRIYSCRPPDNQVPYCSRQGEHDKKKHHGNHSRCKKLSDIVEQARCSQECNENAADKYGRVDGRELEFPAGNNSDQKNCGRSRYQGQTMTPENLEYQCCSGQEKQFLKAKNFIERFRGIE